MFNMDVPWSRERMVKGLLRAHSVGVGRDTAVPVVRAAMAARLNNIPTGGPGVQPHVAEMLIAFLNNGITPIMPSRGSVGQADMTLLSHIGLAMLGEGEVDYRGDAVDCLLPAAACARRKGRCRRRLHGRPDPLSVDAVRHDLRHVAACPKPGSCSRSS
ncbi:aromatic amino acid lyase [Sinorhizobium fredii]|uniref:aromatic amino acid lyase n=1 Tax=Rhizobium fredii TaxID=380 RepID=UPI003518DCF3